MVEPVPKLFGAERLFTDAGKKASQLIPRKADQVLALVRAHGFVYRRFQAKGKSRRRFI
jgi:hypothetical protein